MKLWSVDDGELLHTFPVAAIYNHYFVFSPDDRYLAYGSVTEKLVKIWSLDTYKIISEIETPIFYPVSFFGSTALFPVPSESTYYIQAF